MDSEKMIHPMACDHPTAHEVYKTLLSSLCPEPNVICLDCDGVLTDGKIWVTHDGKTTKGFNSRDLAGIRELISNGFEVHIVTASSWPGACSYLKKSGATLHVIRNKESIPFRYDIAVGDSAWDIPMFQKALVKFCPADAADEVKEIPGMEVLKTNGGEGVVLELCRKLGRKI